MELGALVRELRTGRRWSRRRLAAACGVWPSSVERLETAQRAPRRSLLEILAGALDPDDPAPIVDRLLAAGAGCVVEDTRGSRRWRVKRARRATAAGLRPRPTALLLGRELLEVRQAADRALVSASAALRRAPVTNFPAMERALAAMDAWRALQARADELSRQYIEWCDQHKRPEVSGEHRDG